MRRRVAAVLRRLRRTYGTVEPPQVRPVLDALILTILSQHTSDRNSDAAFAELCRRFPVDRVSDPTPYTVGWVSDPTSLVNWDAVRRASVPRIARAIRGAGLSNVKVPRIRAILERIEAERGQLSLEFLRDEPTEQAEAWLRRLPGVGPKTIACVLLFACRRPVLPVDTHVHRVCRRLGLIGPQVSAEAAHVELPQIVRPEDVLDFHVLLIRHGRTVCSAHAPQCETCPLLDVCRRLGL